MSCYSIIVFPEYEELKKEIEKLRTELSLLVGERDELVFSRCPDIEAAYMLEFGSLELKAYELECSVARAKRKIELIQAKINRCEPIIFVEIEITLDFEFKEYQKKIDEHFEKMNDAIKRNNAKRLSAEDTKELKKLYRRIVKALHPDVNPNITEAQKELFNNAVHAYENGDLKTMRIIAEMVTDPVMPPKTADGISELKKERDHLLEAIESINNEISTIKKSYPYTLYKFIGNEEAKAERRAELEEIIARLTEQLEYYKQKIAEMTGEVINDV